jgi:alkylation response protein AidB-like acyl-CoA dehydrogenase
MGKRAMSIALHCGLEARRLIEAAQSLSPTIIRLLDDIQRERQLPAGLVKQLRELGFFLLFLPRRLGGLELSLTDYLMVVEAVSRIDGTVGWCVTIGGGAPSWPSGFLPDAVAHRIFVADRALVTGNLAPLGQAVSMPGGYRVSGHWAYGSGILHSAWIATGCVVMENGKVRRTSDGAVNT